MKLFEFLHTRLINKRLTSFVFQIENILHAALLNPRTPMFATQRRVNVEVHHVQDCWAENEESGARSPRKIEKIYSRGHFVS